MSKYWEAEIPTIAESVNYRFEYFHNANMLNVCRKNSSTGKIARVIGINLVEAKRTPEIRQLLLKVMEAGNA